MDDELFSLPTLHNDFGVPPWCETTPIPEFGPPISLMAALYDQSMPVPDFINFIPDDGSLASAASLMTPMQPSAFPFLSTYSATSSLITPLDSSASPAVQDKELREYHELPKGKEGKDFFNKLEPVVYLLLQGRYALENVVLDKLLTTSTEVREQKKRKTSCLSRLRPRSDMSLSHMFREARPRGKFPISCSLKLIIIV